MSRRPLLLLAVLALAWVPEARAASGHASGEFSSGDLTVPITDAYAFRGKSSMGKEPALVIAVSNGRFNADALNGWHDRKAMIETYMKNADTGIVYFELAPDGTYSGLSYYLGSGNGCGFCSGSDQKSTVALKAGRLVGTLSGTGDERTFEVTVDVPVAPDDHGTALPGGGEPGKVYAAYQAAAKKGDRAAVKATLAEDQLANWAAAEKDNGLDEYLYALLNPGLRPEAMTVTAGWERDGRALLLVKGTAEGEMQGEVVLRKEKAGWRVQQEVLSSNFY
jgi:hypothetical protein